MDEILTNPGTTSSGRMGPERRLAERRSRSEAFAGGDRRSSRERRSTMTISRPVDPALALRGMASDTSWRPMMGEHDAIPSLAAIAGHPLHPILVPLPIGALALTLASDVAYAATHDRFFARASRVLAATGIASGLLAGAVGAFDFVGRGRVRQHRDAWLHAAGNLAAVGLSAASLATRMRSRNSIPRAAIGMSATVGAILLVTGWLGGELAYRHRVGVVPGAVAG